MIDEQRLNTAFQALAAREPAADLPTAGQILLRAQALAAYERREAETERALRPALVAQLAALFLVPTGLGLWSLALPSSGWLVAAVAAALSPLAFLLWGTLLGDRA